MSNLNGCKGSIIFRLCLILVFTAIVVLMVSCGTDDQQSDFSANIPYSQNKNVSSIYEWSLDGVFTENSGTSFGIQTSEDGTGIYYMTGQTVTYYDPELELSSVVCAQQGCLHQDSSCVAWQGMVNSFGAYRNMWYALLKDKDGSIRVHRTDPSDNSRETIFKRFLPNNRSYFSVGNLYFSYGYAYFSLVTYTESDDGVLDEISAVELIQLDLGNMQERSFIFKDGQGITFVGGTRDSFAVVCEYLDTEAEPILSAEEFYARNPGLDNKYAAAMYSQYYVDYVTDISHKSAELRLYDITSGEYETLVSGNNLFASERGKMCYGDVIVYDILDRSTGKSSLWLYDMDTAKSVCIVEDTWIVEYIFLDGKVFYNVSHSNEGGGYSFYYVDIHTGAIAQIENEGASDYMRYSLVAETADYFISSTGGSTQQSLNKTDYYHDDYSCAKSF